MIRENSLSIRGNSFVTMKRNLIILLLSITLLSLTTSVLAQVGLPNPLGATTTFAALIVNIANYIATLVGGLAVIMFVWAGILYLTAGAKPDNIQKANKAVLYATIGLAVALAGTGLIQLIYFIITGV